MTLYQAFRHSYPGNMLRHVEKHLTITRTQAFMALHGQRGLVMVKMANDDKWVVLRSNEDEANHG